MLREKGLEKISADQLQTLSTRKDQTINLTTKSSETAQNRFDKTFILIL